MKYATCQDFSCQEMRDVSRSGSLDSPRSLCSECLVELLAQQQSLFSPCDNKRENLVRDMKEKGACAASPFELCWLGQFPSDFWE